MRYTITTDATTAECGVEQTVLDALLRSGVWMPNSCNQGSCGTCKIRVRSGRVDHRASPLDTLPETERAAGFALACQATVLSDVVVANPAGGHRETNRLRDFSALVSAVVDVAAETRMIVLSLEEPLQFSAGQYVEIKVPGTDIRRQYSLANPPSDTQRLELHIRRRSGGIASDWWAFDAVRPGQRVDITGPLGDFSFDEDSAGPIVMLAGGTGLAPMKSILCRALASDGCREIVLYHGVRSRRELYDLDFYREMEEEYSGFRFVSCVSREAGGDRAGYVTEAFLGDIASAKNYTGYVCGSEVFVDSAVKALKRRRISPRRLHRERFSPAAPISA